MGIASLSGAKSMGLRTAAAGLMAVAIVLCSEPARAQLPTIDIQTTCKAAAGVMVSLLGGSTEVNDVQICLEAEKKAREQMLRDWSNYQASDRAGCVQPDVYLPSYTEWLTCFEMNKVVREARQQGRQVTPLTNPDGSMTMPTIRWGRKY
jgi:hypothetical protein